MSTTWLVSLWNGGQNVLTASITDPELVSKLKQWAQEQGLRAEVRESESRVWKDPKVKP